MNPLVKISQPQDVALNGPATWDRVKYYAGLAAKFSHASIAAQVMAGFDLLELHKKRAIKPGNPRPETGRGDQLPSDSVIDPDRAKWPDLVRDHAGVSDDTARVWMKMAGGIRAKWKKLAPQDRIKQLMAVPPAEWTEKDTLLIQGALRKAADGATQTEFLRELGLAKKATGNPNGNRAATVRKRLSLAEQTDLRKQQAAEDWAGISRMLDVYKDKFVLLTDGEITGQIVALEEALNARRAWIKQPITKRDPQAITEMFQTK